jgi:hypothetical protein
MESSYISALECRAKWLKWTKDEAPQLWAKIDRELGLPSSWRSAYPFYLDVLENGDTFYMNDKFCDLVDHARDTVPDDLTFDPEWMQSKQGWIFLAEPFETPELIENADLSPEEKQVRKEYLRIAAIGWRELPEGIITAKGLDPTLPGRKVAAGSYQFVCFQSRESYRPDAKGYICWSWFMLCPGDKLLDRIHTYESLSAGQGAYKTSRETDMKHEMRWIYSAFYLMAQRLSISVKHETDRHTKRRNEREKTPVTPFIKVVTLRRLEEDKRRDTTGTPQPIDWAWQWSVRGHWRNQYYPSTGENKPVFVEAYVKGPPDKPFKPVGTRIFVASR